MEADPAVAASTGPLYPGPMKYRATKTVREPAKTNPPFSDPQSGDGDLAKAFGSLGDFFPDTDIRCRIKGCDNVWHSTGEEALHNLARGGNARPERMCDECFELFKGLRDQEIPCANPACEKTATWNRFQQLEAMRQGRNGQLPRLFCPTCYRTIREGGDQEVPCRMKGCDNTWLWPARERLLSEDGRPPRKLCDRCFSMLRELTDRDIPCRVKGCENTWLWNRFQQLEHRLAGKDPDHPPRRMCESCFAIYRELRDAEYPCRIKECDGTWTFRAYEQLEHRLAHGPDAPVPQRLCSRCYDFYRRTVDEQIRCRNRGCNHTWTYTRSMQLYQHVRGKKRPPARACEACRTRLEELEDQAVKCCVPGCSRTWTYTASDQLRDELMGRQGPAAKRCHECDVFLAEHQTITLSCVHCGKEIPWSGYEQLLCELGTFSKPRTCTDCTEQALALEKPRQVDKIEHHLVVRIPSAGRWHEDDLIREWPPRMTHDVIERVEKADLRIVCIGDELTYSLDDEEKSWPYLLEQRLAEHAEFGTVAVVNAGIPFCTTAQGVVRFPRDIRPFEPHIVLFSFTLADARLYRHSGEDSWRPELSVEEMAAAFERFAECLKRTPAKTMYWTPNPIFPDLEEPASGSGGRRRSAAAWSQAQQRAMGQALRVARHGCTQYSIPMLDVRSRFEVNGNRSARKWMGSWFQHNELGARNIATWAADMIVREGWSTTKQ